MCVGWAYMRMIMCVSVRLMYRYCGHGAWLPNVEMWMCMLHCAQVGEI